jgi:hypothetical protein
MRPDVLIVIARARTRSRAASLPPRRHRCRAEAIEASLQLSEAALVGLGLATGPVIASIHEKRDEIRRGLQQAARAAGLQEIRSVRAKDPRYFQKIGGSARTRRRAALFSGAVLLAGVVFVFGRRGWRGAALAVLAPLAG